MSVAHLWQFVREQGVTGAESGVAVVGILLLLAGMYVTPDTLRKPWARMTYKDLIAPFSAFAIGVLCLFVSWRLVRERYLLRPEAGRYTVGTVVEHYSQRGRRKFICAYYVNEQRHQKGVSCGIAEGRELPCPSLDSRRYVYYSTEDPRTSEVTTVLVPDSVRVVPPLGWAKLP